jgi:hypothetical protein
MNLRGIPKDIKKEDFELTENQKRQIDEESVVEVCEAPQQQDAFKIKTILVKEEDQKTEEEKKINLKASIKIIAGIGLAAAGLAAVLLRSKKRR